MYVLGTSGHVDHGKSTLLRLLTGMEPDRLPEEKRREMTIDLNFASLPTARGRVGIIDVPGHKRFVKNMISGVTSIDAFLFVVAADDGWMPQSQEHLDVLSGLGISDGMGIITKTDLVDSDRVKEVEREVGERLERALGKPLAVLRATCKEPSSIEALRGAVCELVDRLPKPITSQKGPRLWIDRVFVPKGMGTVVTGTLREGVLKKGQEVFLWPAGKRAIIKSLQAYHQEIEEAYPATRLAIQLARMDSSEVKRGDLMTLGSDTFLGKEVDARIPSLEKFAKPIRVSLHIGTCSTGALAIPMGKNHMRLKFDVPLPVLVNEKCIIRTSGEEKTLGVGTFLDVEALVRPLKVAIGRLEEIENEMGNFIRYQRLKLGFLDRSAFSKTHPFEASQVELKLKEEHEELSKDLWIDRESLERLKTYAKSKLLQFHHEKGKPIQEKDLFSLLPSFRVLGNEKLRRGLINQLLVSGEIRKDEDGYRHSSTALKADPVEQRLREKLEMTFTGAPPLTVKEVLEKVPHAEKLLYALAKEGLLVRLGSDAFLKKDAYQSYCATIRKRLAGGGSATTSELKDILRLSRKNTIFVLEQMDRDRITYLKDSARRLF